MTAPRAASTVATIAGVTLRRLFRGRAVWISVAIALLPLVFALFVQHAHRARRMQMDLFVIIELLLAVIPPMFVAASIGEEIEDRTATYLWSRPVGRWAVIAGKLVALVPVATVLLVAGWVAAARFELAHFSRLVDSSAAVALGVLAMSLVAAGIATLVPKHGMALTIAYVLFFDLPIGALPASIRQLSIMHHLRVIASVDLTSDDPRLAAVIGVVVIAGLWGTVALWRIRRREV